MNGGTGTVKGPILRVLGDVSVPVPEKLNPLGEALNAVFPLKSGTAESKGSAMVRAAEPVVMPSCKSMLTFPVSDASDQVPSVRSVAVNEPDNVGSLPTVVCSTVAS